MLSLSFCAMKCQMLVICQHDSQAVRQMLPWVADEMMVGEARYSRFCDDSELMQLNRAGTGVVSEHFFELMQYALLAARWSDGLINPTVYQALLDSGYRQSFEQMACQQTESQQMKGWQIDGQATTTQAKQTATPSKSPTAYQDIIINHAAQSIQLPDGVKLDLGGFAKLICATKAVMQFYERTGKSVLLDAGGDVVTQGDLATAWLVHLPTCAIAKQLPHHLLPAADDTITTRLSLLGWLPIDEIATLQLTGSNVLSTSGIDYRYWHDGHRLQHHLVNLTCDNRSDIVNASVLIGKAMIPSLLNTLNQLSPTQNYPLACTNLAQSLSKLCCLKGVQASLAYLDDNHLHDVGMSWIIHTQTGYQQWLNPAMQRHLSQQAP